MDGHLDTSHDGAAASTATASASSPGPAAPSTSPSSGTQPSLSPSPAGGKRNALSPSRVKDFKQCPLLFRFRCVDRLEEPGSLATHKGTVVHAVLEDLFDLPAAQRTEAAAQAMLEPHWQAHREANPAVDRKSVV